MTTQDKIEKVIKNYYNLHNYTEEKQLQDINMVILEMIGEIEKVCDIYNLKEFYINN